MATTPSPMERLTLTMDTMAASVAQLMGMHPEIHLKRTEERTWECTQAAPDVWFGEPFLTPVGTPWTRQGDCIKLTAANGTWVWRLTGETTTAENIDGPLTMHRAVWPD